MLVANIIQEFAKFGFTKTPLTVAEIEGALAQGLDAGDIYLLACDVASGFDYADTVKLYLN